MKLIIDIHQNIYKNIKESFDMPLDETILIKIKGAIKHGIPLNEQEPCDTHINWQYCTNLNDINKAIKTKDEDWEGLTSADDIINITWRDGCYVIFWRVENKKSEVNTNV